MKLFTKSAFKQALTCPASLYYYYDDHYANQNNEDDFLQSLADGGNQVGDLAKVYYDVKPEADLSDIKGYDESVVRTKELLKEPEINIAEAAFRWGDCFVRADIIEKKGNLIHLIEVKAKSWNSDEGKFMQARKPDTTDKGIREYLYDVAFQKYVIQNALGPNYEVKAALMMADETVVADYDGINQFFRLEKVDEHHNKVVRAPGAEVLRDYHWVLTAFDEVDEIADRIIAGETGEQMEYMGCFFKDFVEKMSDLYVNHKQVSEIQLKGACWSCPFHTDGEETDLLDGRKQCFSSAGIAEDDFKCRPSVGELWCGQVGGKRSLKDELTKAGKYFLDCVSEDDIKPKSSSTKHVGLSPLQRRMLQIGLATGDSDKLKPFKDKLHDGVYVDVAGLKKLILDPEKGWRFPYHMIDFETTSVALPFYKGVRPYEPIAFQFSHHIIEADGTIRHAGQYINTAKHHFPNFDFVRELKRQLEGDNGTIFRYADHENTILRAIRRQLKASTESDKDELISFIDSITHPSKKEKCEVTGPRDMVDLLKVVQGYYYHPSMKGSNSIKAVLPAVLSSSKAIQAKYSKPIYGDLIESQNYKDGATKTWITTIYPDGSVESPYHQLDSIASLLGVTEEELARLDSTYIQEGEQIANGGAALVAYTKLQFCTDAEADAIAKALLRYCELDTMSMVFIMEYFQEMMAKY